MNPGFILIIFNGFGEPFDPIQADPFPDREKRVRVTPQKIGRQLCERSRAEESRKRAQPFAQGKGLLEVFEPPRGIIFLHQAGKEKDVPNINTKASHGPLDKPMEQRIGISVFSG
jgi:hypothetical protein